MRFTNLAFVALAAVSAGLGAGMSEKVVARDMVCTADCFEQYQACMAFASSSTAKAVCQANYRTCRASCDSGTGDVSTMRGGRGGGHEGCGAVEYNECDNVE